jgi:putative transposase
MKFDLRKHHRRSVRLKGYDYSREGAYFVTLVVRGRGMLFGEIVEGETPYGGAVVLNEFGEIVSEKWQWLETQYPYVELVEWVVMPNHFHAILIINDDGRGGSRFAPTYSGQP